MDSHYDIDGVSEAVEQQASHTPKDEDRRLPVGLLNQEFPEGKLEGPPCLTGLMTGLSGCQEHDMLAMATQARTRVIQDEVPIVLAFGRYQCGTCAARRNWAGAGRCQSREARPLWGRTDVLAVLVHGMVGSGAPKKASRRGLLMPCGRPAVKNPVILYNMSHQIITYDVV
ncbi:hypothetical protein BD779DRAFT_1479549 [Infundibulicybe gibba]|nr:hypothetical protein BD779DRAFT_1479549 [Infundibulicybe gibba]